MDKKRFIPTDVGRVVNKFLTNYFTQYVDYDFTARLEDELDAVSRRRRDWVPLLEKFWQPFKDRVDHTQENVQRSDVPGEDRRTMPEVRQSAGDPARTQRPLRRLYQLPGCDTRNLDDSGAAAAEPEKLAINARNVARTWCSNRPLRPLHRLLQLSDMPLH